MLPSKLIGAVVAAVTFLVPRLGQAEAPSIDRYVDEVLSRNPALAASSLKRGAFREEAKAAGAYPDPTLSVMLDRVPRTSMDGEMPMLRYQLAQMFPWPGKLGLMHDAVERQGDAAEAELAAKRIELRFSAKRAWLMLAENAKHRAITKASRGVAALIAGAALARYGAGAADHHDVARAQVEVTAIDAELLDLDGERTSAVAMLNALRNRPSETAIDDPAVVPAAPDKLDAAKLTETAEKQRPELKQMAAMREEMTTMVKLAKKEPLPDLMGALWVNQNIGAAPSVGGMIGGTIPLFGASKNAHRASAYSARAASASAEQEAMRAMIRFEVTDAVTKVTTAQRRIDLLVGVARPKAEESFQSGLASYAAGRVPLVSLLDARRAVQAIEIAIADAEVERAIAAAQVERVTGGTP